MQWLCIFVIYLSSLSVKRDNRGQCREAIGKREALRHVIYVQYVTECLLLWLAVLTNKHRNIFSQMTLSLSFCHTWQHEALETFCLPSITLAGKAKLLMVTPGSIHVWLLSCLSNINKITHMHMFDCIYAQTHCCSMHTEIWFHLRVGNNLFSSQPETYGHHHSGLKTVPSVKETLVFINILKIISCNYVCLSPKQLHATWSSPLNGHASILWSQELFMLLNKPFITVIWIFFSLDGAFVCLIKGRQENKNSSPLW